jgi:hypothetical protein
MLEMAVAVVVAREGEGERERSVFIKKKYAKWVVGLNRRGESVT